MDKYYVKHLIGLLQCYTLIQFDLHNSIIFTGEEWQIKRFSVACSANPFT